MSYEHDVETAVVTGATGTVGPWVVDRLADRGVEVVGIDLDRPGGTRSNARFRDVDLTDAAETWETFHEVDPDAVVHLAALPDLLDTPGTRVFENNATSTYNALVAAGRVGADVVWTSSQAVYGGLFAAEPWLPDYLPIDEGHPRRPEDPYGLSKLCSEEIARMASRRYDVPVTTIRPATIYAPGTTRLRPADDGFDLSSADLSGDFWSYVDVRDLARMVEAGLAADYGGHETFHCVADENYLGHPTADVIEAAAGELPSPCALDGQQAALSNEKAKTMLDWEPTHEWRGEAANAPDRDWL